MAGLSGYEFATNMLDRFPADAVDRILAETRGETEWLEFKAGMCLLPEDERKGDRPADLHQPERNIRTPSSSRSQDDRKNRNAATAHRDAPACRLAPADADQP